MSITQFTSEYYWLSNFYSAPVLYRKLLFPTVEHAFQAAKTRKKAEALEIQNAFTPLQAKRLGKKATLRDDWEDVKDQVMAKLLAAKFEIPVLRRLLLATGDEDLVEGNHWHDNYWGSCTCDKCGNGGKNKLGKLLMQLRTELQVD